MTEAIPPVVDANQFAEAFSNQIGALAQSLRPAPVPQEQRDEIAELAGQLKAGGVPEEEIPNHIATALSVDRRANRLLEEKLNATANQFRQELKNQRLTSAVDRAINAYAKDDELIAEVKDTLRNRAIRAFFHNVDAKTKSEFNNWNAGNSFDEEVVETLVGNEVKKIDGKRGGTKGTGSPTPPSSTGVPARGGPGDKAAVTLQPGDPMGHFQEITYNSHLGSLLRSGYTPEAAQARALAAAARIPNNR